MTICLDFLTEWWLLLYLHNLQKLNCNPVKCKRCGKKMAQNKQYVTRLSVQTFSKQLLRRQTFETQNPVCNYSLEIPPMVYSQENNRVMTRSSPIVCTPEANTMAHKYEQDKYRPLWTRYAWIVLEEPRQVMEKVASDRATIFRAVQHARDAAWRGIYRRRKINNLSKQVTVFLQHSQRGVAHTAHTAHTTGI